MNTLGDNLTHIIKVLGLTKKSFAESIKLGQSHISDMCNDKKPIKEYHYLLFEKIHGVNPEFIKTGKGDMFLKKYQQSQKIDFLSKIIELVKTLSPEDQLRVLRDLEDKKILSDLKKRS